MSLQLYWLVIAPGVVLLLSAAGWVALWLTRDPPIITFSQFDNSPPPGPRLWMWVKHPVWLSIWPLIVAGILGIAMVVPIWAYLF
jgi:hypothetical protein